MPKYKRKRRSTIPYPMIDDAKFFLPIYGIVSGRALSFNWLINARHRELLNARRDFKRYMKPQLSNLQPIKGKIHIHYTYYAKSNRKQNTDLDNFTVVVMKFFQDCLTVSGKIVDDNVKFIVSNSQEFGGFDSDNSRVEAEIFLVE